MYVCAVWGLRVLYANVGSSTAEGNSLFSFLNFFCPPSNTFISLYIIAKNPVPIYGTLSAGASSTYSETNMYIRLPGSECHTDSVAIGTSVQHGPLTLLWEYQGRPAGRAAARQAQREREGKEERGTTLTTEYR